VQATPPGVLVARLDALTRRRQRERAETLMDIAMSNEINYGQAVKGQMPRSKAGWSLVDTPFRAYHRALERAGLGLPLAELPTERQARFQAENKKLRTALLN